MKRALQLHIVLACGLACTLVGCKSPMTWFSKSGPIASTAPMPQYNGTAGSSSTLNAGAGTQIVSGESPGMMSRAWSSTTTSVTSLFGTAPKAASDATSLSSYPKQLDADIYLRAAHMAERGGKYQEAEGKYQEALKAEPKSVDAMLGLARLYDQMGNSQQAVATYQKAIKLHPKSAKVYNDLGLCFAQRKELAAAEQNLQKAVELEPGRANYRNNLATVLVDLGRPADAYQHMLSAQPQPIAHYNLACLLQSRGQNDQAAGHLREALAQDPTLTPARELLAQLEGAPQGNMQMASATIPSRDRSQPAPQNRRQAREESDLQPPAIQYAPTGPAGQDSIYQPAQDPAPQPQYPTRRSSYEDEAPAEESSSGPAKVSISDDE